MPTIDDSSSKAIRIQVPASTSNLGAAFDAVGLALQLYLRIELRKLDAGPSSFVFTGQDSHLVPSGESNSFWQTMLEVAAAYGLDLPPVSVRLENHIPIAKGLGSSAAMRLGAIQAVNLLCKLNLDEQDLLRMTVAYEGHPDNVAPALLGGLVASICGEKISCSRSAFPPEWTVVTVTPDFELETKLARAVLPASIPHKNAVYNIQRAAFLMAQLVQGRREGLREAMTDLLHQPYRSPLLPGLKEVLSMEECTGLLGVALSGAGPTIIAFSDSNEAAIGARIREILQGKGLTSTARLLKADNQGLVAEHLQ